MRLQRDSEGQDGCLPAREKGWRLISCVLRRGSPGDTFHLPRHLQKRRSTLSFSEQEKNPTRSTTGTHTPETRSGVFRPSQTSGYSKRKRQLKNSSQRYVYLKNCLKTSICLNT